MHKDSKYYIYKMGIMVSRFRDLDLRRRPMALIMPLTMMPVLSIISMLDIDEQGHWSA